jgi:hypothetical protein
MRGDLLDLLPNPCILLTRPDQLPIDLDADPPTVTAEAAYSKRRRRDVQPLRPDVAQMLRRYIAGQPEDRPLWPGSWTNKGAKMVRMDLTAAGLPYEDGAGRVFDFHAIRH